MARQFFRGVVMLAASMALLAQQPTWTDRAEYELFESIQKEPAAAKKIELLGSWKQKYPNSPMRPARHAVTIQTYVGMNDGKKLYDACKEVVAEDPKNVTSLYYLNLLTISLNNTTADGLDTGEKSAQGLLGVLDTVFAADKRPQQTTEEAFQKERKNMESIAHKTVGWVQWQRKSYDAAEASLTKSLEANTAQGDVSYWLGTVILLQRKTEKQAAAMWHFARAGNYAGPGAMPEATRKQVAAYFAKNYTNFHGDASGMDDIIKEAVAKPFPPSTFKIVSKLEIEMQNEEKMKAENPTLFLWLSVKKQLQAAEGDKYFADQIKDSDFQKLKGKIISHTPDVKPKEVVVSVADGLTPEITLKFEEALPGKADPGTELEFQGVPSAFSKEPFMLTLDVEKDKLTGWPVQAPAPKKAPAAKKAGGAGAKGKKK
ncbi:MAG: hypothetical protein FJW40_10775 [Acidobacteria bacterium]|nr:hypothetical protein [Acidobacteriota bacterium]